MRGGNQRRCGPPLYTGLFCIALVLYAIANPFNSTLSSVYKQDAASLHLFFPAHRHCEAASLLPAGEKYMLYSPHSGFGNQVGELKNALLIAALLNRTLVLPPIFDHHAVALGSCPKFRVHEPHEMRTLAWAHISDLIQHRRYLAMADVLDLSSVASMVKLVDLRIFSLLWCGVDVSSACSSSFCRRLTAHGSIWGTLEGCGALLSRPDEAHGSCVYAVNEDCRTTIWVYGVKSLGGSPMNGSFSAQASAVNEGLSNKNNKERYGRRSPKDIVETLGNGSEAGKYQVLSFGSLFSSEYKGTQLHVDIESSKDPKVRALVEAMKFFPFTPSIVNAGKLYSKEKIRQPFFCAQLRLLDGQFKNHWGKTFASLQSQLDVSRSKQGRALSQVLHVFVMTDLPRSNWSKTYLGELEANKLAYKLYTIDGNDPLIRETAFKVANDEYGLKLGFLPLINKNFTENRDHVALGITPDVLLFVEEVICSCATLGFAGTSGSTLSENILQLRMGNICTVNI